MKELTQLRQMYFSSLSGTLSTLFGNYDPLLVALIVFIDIDYLSGILLSVRNKSLSSKVGFNGICKKAHILILVSMATIIDNYIIGVGNGFRTLLIMFFISNEGISILENAGQAGIPVPKKFQDIIYKLKDRH